MPPNARNLSDRADPQRIIYVAAPLLSYSLSVGLGGNGFVSAFALRRWRSTTSARRKRNAGNCELIDDVAVLLTAFMWFVVAGIGVIALMSGGVTWGMPSATPCSPWPSSG